VPAAKREPTRKPEMNEAPTAEISVGAKRGKSMRLTASWVPLTSVAFVCGHVSASEAESRKITEDEKKFCAEAYHKYCGEYGLESAALRNCMDRNGRALPHDCIDALVDAGEISRSEVERRKKSRQ
jgi:hypothetical protein